MINILDKIRRRNLYLNAAIIGVIVGLGNKPYEEPEDDFEEPGYYAPDMHIVAFTNKVWIKKYMHLPYKEKVLQAMEDIAAGKFDDVIATGDFINKLD
jgi:hypothetical protein